MTTFPSNYQKISKTQQVFSPHSYYHTLPLAKIRKKEARNVSSSKIIPLETPYKKSLQGEKRARHCPSPRKKTDDTNFYYGTRIIIDQSGYRYNTRATFEIYFYRSRGAKFKKGEKNLLDTRARSLKFVGHFRFVRRKGIRRRARKSKVAVSQ